MSNFKGLARPGVRFGRLVVLNRMPNRKWLCVCDCGKEKTVLTANLTRNTRSCGCLRKDLYKTLNKRHGYFGTRVYNIWAGMIRRCSDKSRKEYKNYGGKGISVCERWKRFENFLSDMGEPTKNLTLDRINVNGNYEPGNCRWATWKEQARNKRRNRLFTINGETMCIAAWIEKLKLKRGTVDTRLRRGLSIEAALGLVQPC